MNATPAAADARTPHPPTPRGGRARQARVALTCLALALAALALAAATAPRAQADPVASSSGSLDLSQDRTPPATPLGEPVTFGGGHVDWGFANRWRCYVVGNIARGGIDLSGGVTRNDGTLATGPLCNGRNAGSETLRFPVRGGFYDPVSGRLEVSLRGTVRFWGHDYHVPGDTTPQLDTRFSNLRVVVEGDAGTLYADALGATMDSPQPRTYTQVALVTLDASAVEPLTSDTGLAWSDVPTALAAGGAEVFGSYAAGEPFDPITLALVYGTPSTEPDPQPEPGPQPEPNPQPEPSPQPAPSPQPGPGPAPGPDPGGPATTGMPPAATAPPAARRQPAIATLSKPRGVQRVDGRGVARIATLACARAAACRVTAPERVRVRIGDKRYALGVLAPKAIRAGRRGSVRVRLPKAAVDALAGRTAAVKVRVTVGAQGRATTRVVTARIRGAARAGATTR